MESQVAGKGGGGARKGEEGEGTLLETSGEAVIFVGAVSIATRRARLSFVFS
jgi:hypothetical protein